ncbi:PREDICTED: uncharacterized acetyltransferase At3g50280-like [Prunus mume]|uniref:Uncharacterized acetyltransferase At3g50280-like n=1 Tax=Prunus mume TaxID=102107 RepID=A0ABM0PLW0_PRUMU|nr:PREDICTED: uncharacterized acetyltransferase At3g50280-like [Prunus mume]
MGNVRFISTTTVQPTTHKDEFTRRIELTPWDLQLLLVDQVQKGLLFHKPSSTYENEDLKNGLVQHLKSSLSLTLDIFYPLAGRLAITEHEDDNSSSFSVDCNGAGVGFVHAVANGVTVADILDPVLVPDDIVYSLFTMNGVLNYESVSNPLLAVQVTELVDGIFIGCTVNHCVVDGSIFWRFFNTWSEISRDHGFGKISQPPLIFGREFLDGIIDLPVRIPFFHNQIPEKFLPPGSLQQRMFHFPKEKLAQLKAKANAEMGTTKISSLQALLAHLWVSITRNKRLSPDQETKYLLLVGLRQRFQPLPEEYLGNAVLLGTVTSTVGDLLKQGLGWAALEMNKMIASKTEQEVRKHLEEWVKSPKLSKMGTLSVNSLATGSSPRFNVFGNDFGWGRPLAVRSGAGNKFDGKLTVFPGTEDGSIDFEACLSSQTLQALAQDAEFMDSVA